MQSAFRTTEKNRSGPQRHRFPPTCPKSEPLGKRFFFPYNSKALICRIHLRINRMNGLFLVARQQQRQNTSDLLYKPPRTNPDMLAAGLVLDIVSRIGAGYIIVKLILAPGRRTRLSPPWRIDWKKQYLQLYYEQVSQFPHHWDGLYW